MTAMGDTRGILDLDPDYFAEHPEEWGRAVAEIASVGVTGEEAARGFADMAMAVQRVVDVAGELSA